LALPVITANGLIFRELTPLTLLVQGTFGTLWPDERAPILIPDMLLIPLAVFDRQGHRIGYGQGHYDKTLATLTATKIGVGFASQEVPHVPFEPHDVRLDAVLTQNGLITIDKSLNND
jgi:5-formyltetrahydrofolate cyclo-ligase